MRDKKPTELPVIDVTDYRVIDEPPRREPVIKNWPGLIAFVGFTLLAIFLRYLQIISSN